MPIGTPLLKPSSFSTSTNLDKCGSTGQTFPNSELGAIRLEVYRVGVGQSAINIKEQSLTVEDAWAIS